jgi:hypothetical protein
MSTKIYDGKRLPDMSVLELHQFCQRLKAKLIPIAKTEYCKLAANIAQSAYMYTITGQNICDYSVDMTSLTKNGTTIDKYSLFSFARDQASKLVVNTSAAIRRMDSEPDADFDVSICVFPIHDKILCIPFANHDSLHDALFSTEEFVEYGYWNNVDPPAKISNDEWHRRKEDWDEALPGIGVPRDCGMLFKIIDAPYDVVGKTILAIADIAPYFKSNKELCNLYAEKIIFEREFQKKVEELGGDWMKHGYTCLRSARIYVDSHQDEVDMLSEDYRDAVKCLEFFSSDKDD